MQVPQPQARDQNACFCVVRCDQKVTKSAEQLLFLGTYTDYLEVQHTHTYLNKLICDALEEEELSAPLPLWTSTSPSPYGPSP